MTQLGYQHFADALVFVHGQHALNEALRHAAFCRESGNELAESHWLATIAEVRSGFVAYTGAGKRGHAIMAVDGGPHQASGECSA